MVADLLCAVRRNSDDSYPEPTALHVFVHLFHRKDGLVSYFLAIQGGVVVEACHYVYSKIIESFVGEKGVAKIPHAYKEGFVIFVITQIAFQVRKQGSDLKTALWHTADVGCACQVFADKYGVDVEVICDCGGRNGFDTFLMKLPQKTIIER